MVFKFQQGLAPEYLCSKLVHRESGHSLRDSVNKVNVPEPRANYYNDSFSYRGAVLWNRLPLELRKAESLNQFKRLIREAMSAII